MPVEQDQRPSFFQGQYLGPEDLTAAVDYERIQRARHSLGAHTWGIGIGVQLIEKPSPAGNNQVDVFLEPGYAWDGFGRTIVVLAPYKIPPQLFQGIVYDASADDPANNGQGAAGRPVKIWLRYSETTTRPPTGGFEICDASGLTSRVHETFALEIGEHTNASEQRDSVSIGGKTMDAQQALVTFDPSAPQIYDLSIPHQALPEDDAEALWLIPVGYVRWLPPQTPTTAGSFQKRTATDLAKSQSARRYIGVVAEAVEAADQVVRVKRRSKAPSSIASDDLLWVEGKMRVEGDASLFAGKLSFLNAGGKDDGVPLLIQRTTKTDPTTLHTLRSLDVEIGKSNSGDNMFSVGPLDNAGKLVPIFNVLDNGKVGVGATNPRNPLAIRASGTWEELISFEDPAGNTKWHINQNANGNNSGINIAETNVADFRVFIKAGGNIGLGTSSPTGRLTLNGVLQPAQGLLTFFSQAADIEYDGGDDHVFLIRATGNAVTSFVGGNVGLNTTAPTNRLHVSDASGIRQNRMYLSGDLGWSSLSYNAFHDAANVWRFPDPGHAAATIEMDDHPGHARFDVWTTTTAAKTTWQQRLHIDGDSGHVGINNPNPVQMLDVIGHVHISGNITAAGNLYPSDERLKEAIEPLRGALNTLLLLRGVRFRWKEPERFGGHSGPQIGLIAQDVEPIFPDWVRDDEHGYKVLGHRGIEALLIEAIRELKQQVDALARRIGDVGEQS